METITVFRTENGETVKKVWIIGDNKESENEKATIKDPRNIHEKEIYNLGGLYVLSEEGIKAYSDKVNETNYETFKERCMQDKETKKEFDKLQPKYDKIKEDIQKEINKEKSTNQSRQMKEKFDEKAYQILLNVYKLYCDGEISKSTMQKLVGAEEFVKVNDNSYRNLKYVLDKYLNIR